MNNFSFSELEKAAASLSRGLLAPLDWPFLLEEAQKIVAASLSQNLEALCDPQRTPELFAAARVLDGAAQYARFSSGEKARELGAWAAVAFGMSGNFPSAGAVFRRTWVKKSGHDAATSALLVAINPAHAASLHQESRFAALLNDFLGGREPRDAVRAAWDEIAPQTPLFAAARVALEQALRLATRPALQNVIWPQNYTAKVAAEVPILLPPQLLATQTGFLGGKGNALAALPPGTGKTLLGELFLMSALGEKPGFTVFVAPYVALARQVAASFAEHLPEGVRLHRFWGGQSSEAKLDPRNRAEIVVATPERFDALLRHQPEVWKHLRAVVVDEAHLIGEGARGARLEGILGRIRLQQNQGNRTRVLVMSAALAHSENVADWLEIAPERKIIQNWTPAARRLGFWRCDGSLEWHGELVGARLESLGSQKCVPPHPNLRPASHFVAQRRLEPLVWGNAAFFARNLVETRGGPLLCLAATRRGTRDLAKALGAVFPVSAPPEGARAAAISAIAARHAALAPLAELLKKGVAWHNSSLPHEIRGLLECAVSEGGIEVVAATTTLAEGVDLPFRFTLLADWLVWGDDGQKPLSPALFANIAGRCGRAGAFTEGDTILLDNPLGPQEWTHSERRAALQNELYLSSALPMPQSALAAQQTPEIAAVWASQVVAHAAEGVEISPVAFLAGQGENWARLEQEAAATRAELETRGWMKNGVLTSLGRALNATELAPPTAQKLREALETLPDANFSTPNGAARLNAHLLRVLKDAPESGAEVGRFWAPRSRFRKTDLALLGRLWLRGESPERIGAQLRGLKEDETLGGDELDKTGDFLRAIFETWTPWIWRAAGHLAPFCGPRAQKIEWQNWARRFEEGVDNDWAVAARFLNAPGGRRALAAVGRNWPWPVEKRDSLRDPLRLRLLGEGELRGRADQALEAALKEVGGRYCVEGANVLAVRDWVWERAGLGLDDAVLENAANLSR